jgi:hypothetical protein
MYPKIRELRMEMSNRCLGYHYITEKQWRFILAKTFDAGINGCEVVEYVHKVMKIESVWLLPRFELDGIINKIIKGIESLPF